MKTRSSQQELQTLFGGVDSFFESVNQPITINNPQEALSNHEGELDFSDRNY